MKTLNIKIAQSYLNKIVQSYLNKKNINNLKKFINTRNLIIGTVAFTIVIILSYLLRPVFFDYESNKEILKEKINNYLKVQSNITGDVSYYFFPKPRIVVENLEINFDDSNKKPIILKKSNFSISLFKLKSLNEIEIKKIYIANQRIQIFPSQYKNYLEYFQKYNVENFVLKNCEIFFIDGQNNDISINNFNLKNYFRKNKETISIKGVFAQNKFKIRFLNEKNKEKYLDFSIPSLSTYLKIIFNEESSLEKTSGKLNLKILNNIFLLNFDGDNIYKISESFFRSKFLNSKLDGTINFKDNFYFDLNSRINQVNLRKLFLYYDSSIRDKSSGQFNISKKINGKIDVNLKKNESYIGVVEKTNFILLFENGNIKIKSGSANISKNSKLKFNISLLGKGKDQKIIFFINFLSDKGKEFLKKFNLNTEEQDISLNAVGKIDVIKKKIKFDNLIVNQGKLKSKNLSIVENSFNQQVINDNVLGFLDFFKIKKFVRDVYAGLE